MIRPLWHLLAGFTLWAIAFVVLYSLQALGCIWAWPEPVHRATLIALWAVTLAGMVCILAIQLRRRDGARPLMATMGIVATVAALAATVLSFFPVTFSTLCI